jgi:hypothetical protein
MYSDGISTRIYSDDGISTSFAPYALAYFTLASAFVVQKEKHQYQKCIS